MEEKLNRSDDFQQEQIDIDEQHNQEISEQNIECAAEIYKRFIALQTAEKVKGQEGQHSNQCIMQFTLNESHASEPGETPQFGTRIDYQNMPELEMNPNVNSNLTKNSEERENQNNQIQVKQIVEEAQKQSQKSRLLPLYGIDHSKQFFEQCPTLTVLLKKYKDFVRSYCWDEISSKNFKEGYSFKDGLSLTGSELKQLGRAVYRNVFRRMEQYIFNICKKNIAKISEKDVLQLAQFLLDQSNLEQDYFEIFRKFMKLSFDIPAQITENQVIQLYTFLMRWLKQKHDFDIFQFDYNQSSQKPRFVWNRERQIKFCQQYQSNKSLRKVLEAINRENVQPKATILDLRYKLAQLIKATIKKIEAEFRKYEKKQAWIPLLQNDLKTIVRDPKALSLRILLLKINTKKYVFLDDIKKIVLELDSFFKENSEQKEQNKLVLANKKRATSDSSSSDDKDQEQQSSQSSQSKDCSASHKNDKQKTNHTENTPKSKQYQQTLINCFEKNLEKPKEWRKIVPSNASSSFKQVVSQLEKFTPKFKNKPKNK